MQQTVGWDDDAGREWLRTYVAAVQTNDLETIVRMNLEVGDRLKFRSTDKKRAAYDRDIEKPRPGLMSAAHDHGFVSEDHFHYHRGGLDHEGRNATGNCHWHDHEQGHH